MATVDPIYLTDSGGQTWLLGVTNSALLQTTPVVHSGVPFVTIADSVILQTWDLSALPSGMLQVNPSATTSAPLQLPIVAPNGTIYAVQVASGLLQTALFTGQGCPFSLGDADTALASRLFDVGGQFWPLAERTMYINEALRTWNALTAYWRGQFLFDAVPSTQWYDMTDVTVMPNTLRPETMTVSDLMIQIQYHLLEPPVGTGVWTGSTQYSNDDLKLALQRRRNETLGATGAQVHVLELPATAIRTTLPSNVTDVRRVAFKPADPNGVPNVLWKDDTWALDSYDPDHTVHPPGIPSAYHLSTEPWLTFDVDVMPEPGTFELLVVTAGSENETPTSIITNLEVPDDWTWVIKFGALSDLFNREMNSKDSLRADYCEKRYRDGLRLLNEAPALMAIRLNNVPVHIDSLKDSDQYDTDWESQSPGVPSRCLVGGLNVFALSPKPDAVTNYSMTVTVVQNAPVAAATADCLMLDRSIFDVIVDYAQHLAMLKCGGAEFEATLPHYQRFLKAAALYASKFAELGQYSQILYELSNKEELTNPRYAVNSGLEAENG